MDANLNLDRSASMTALPGDDVLAELDKGVLLRACMIKLAHVMTVLGHRLAVTTRSHRFVDRSRLIALLELSRETSALGKELLAEASNQRTCRCRVQPLGDRTETSSRMTHP